ncbi:MAG: hypothetical protein ABIT01_01790 [Thermoanaerobaculia bacterium]
MIHAVGYRIRAQASGRSLISICVFGAVHLVVEAALDPETSLVHSPTVLVVRSPNDTSAEGSAYECNGSCRDALHSVQLTVELREEVEHAVRRATSDLIARLEQAKRDAPEPASGTVPSS